MSSYDRPSDIMNQTGVRPPSGGMNPGGMSPSLTEQTPGLDTTAKVRDFAMRPVAWVRERPEVALSILGGIAVIGLGTWLAFRSRRPTGLEAIKCRAEDLASQLSDFIRSKF